MTFLLGKWLQARARKAAIGPLVPHTCPLPAYRERESASPYARF